MTNEQTAALHNLCDRYHVTFNPDDYKPQFDLPQGYVAGWVGGDINARHGKPTIFVGCSPEGEIHS